MLQPFAALYVLILAVLGPLLTKETKAIYRVVGKFIKFDSTQRSVQHK